MYKRDFKQSRFTKTVGMSEKHHKYLNKIKKKKTLAGMLEFIINHYRNKNKSYDKR